MQQVENTRKIDSLVQRALAGGGVAAKPGRDGGTQGRTARPAGSRRLQSNPCEILQRLAQVIQLMRLDHADAHFYRDGCDVLVQDAVDASKWSGLPRALAQIMNLVGAGRLSLRPHGTAGDLAAGMAHMLSAPTKLRRGRTAVAALVAALTLSALAPLARADDSAAPKPVAAASEQGMLVGVGARDRPAGDRRQRDRRQRHQLLDRRRPQAGRPGALARPDQARPRRRGDAERPASGWRRRRHQDRRQRQRDRRCPQHRRRDLAGRPAARRRRNRSCHRPGADRRGRRADRRRRDRRCRRRHADGRACAGCGHQASATAARNYASLAP